MIVGIGWVIGWHPDLHTLVVVLIDHIVLDINLISLLIHYNRTHNELFQLFPGQPVNHLCHPRLFQPLFISLLFPHAFLQGAVLQEYSLGLERVHQLLTEADAVLAVVLAAKHDNHLLRLLVLHNDHAILEVEVDQDVLRGVDPEGLQCQLGRVLGINPLKKVQVLLVGFGQVELAEEAAKHRLVLLLEEEAELIGVLVELEEER